MAARRWARVLVVVGLVLMVVVIADPLEGSILTVPGVGAIAAAAILLRSRYRTHSYWAAALLVLGVCAMWILSAKGGIGGDTGRSMWWAVVMIPYPVGWLYGLLVGIRLLREAFRRAEPTEPPPDAHLTPG